MTAAFAHCNTLQRSVYNYARRPILRTGLRPVQLSLVAFIICDVISVCDNVGNPLVLVTLIWCHWRLCRQAI